MLKPKKVKSSLTKEMVANLPVIKPVDNGTPLKPVDGTPLKPVKKSLLQKEKERLNKNVQGLKDLVGKAADKANSRYKKVKKTGIGGRTVTKEKGLFTRTVDGKEQLVREKRKTVIRKDGTVKKNVTKGRGVMGSVIGRYKDVKRFKS